MIVRPTQMLLALLLLPLLTACGSTPLESTSDFNQNYDFSKVRNIAFQPIDRAKLNTIRVSDMQVERINEALASDLRRKGFTLVDDNKEADLLLVWHLVTQEKTDVRSYNSASYYNCWRCGPAVSDVSVRQYTEGTFIVDMIDPMRGQSVWRSTIQSKLSSKPDPEAAPERRREAAMAIFSHFPPL
jgi:hypothetical protein